VGLPPEQRLALLITPHQVLHHIALLALLEAGVAGGTEGLEWTRPKQVEVTTPWGDVVYRVGCCGPTCCLAHAEEGLDGELVRPERPPGYAVGGFLAAILVAKLARGGGHQGGEL
jgi:hypothetical protein